jgi:hypothetical protein
MNQASTRQFGLLQVGIGALTMATALMHFFLVFPSLLFMLNGVGYVVLLAALYLPIAQLAPYRRQIRWALMAYTAVTIVAWIAIGSWGLYAYADKLIEVVLLVLLWLESRQAG